MTAPDLNQSTVADVRLLPVLWVLWGHRIGFVRIFGYGIAWKDTRRHRLLFSERNGVWRHWDLGPWRLHPLRRNHDTGWRIRRG